MINTVLELQLSSVTVWILVSKSIDTRLISISCCPSGATVQDLGTKRRPNISGEREQHLLGSEVINHKMSMKPHLKDKILSLHWMFYLRHWTAWLVEAVACWINQYLIMHTENSNWQVLEKLIRLYEFKPFHYESRYNYNTRFSLLFLFFYNYSCTETKKGTEIAHIKFITS